MAETPEALSYTRDRAVNIKVWERSPESGVVTDLTAIDGAYRAQFVSHIELRRAEKATVSC
jgi:hypothetical protein